MTSASLLIFYGCFLMTCGIVAVSFIGLKAKTALISGGSSGTFALILGWLCYKQFGAAPIAGIVLSTALVVVFSWRVTKTLFALFDMIPEKHPDVKGKGIAFLIIGLMAVISIVITALQVVIV